jgi:hypothetical protein
MPSRGRDGGDPHTPGATAWGQESEGEGDEGDTPESPRLWFLRDPAAMARRLVLAEIVGVPRSRAVPQQPPVTTRKRG